MALIHNQASLANDQIFNMKLKMDEVTTLPKWKRRFPKWSGFD
jgi:hypothetical protein